jgi:putative intracellular protease/amidase
MASRPAAGGGRWVDVDPDRLPRWLAGFAERHGPVTAVASGSGVQLRAADGEVATLYPAPGAPPPADLDALLAEAVHERRIGLLLIRRGGYAIGTASGPTLKTSKVDSRYVQGRTAAGGWSQQRFARRRDNQTRAACEEAARAAERLLVPQAGRLATLVCGGDRRLVDAVLAEPALAVLRPLRSDRFLDVPDPKLTVLNAAVRGARAVRVHLAP